MATRPTRVPVGLVRSMDGPAFPPRTGVKRAGFVCRERELTALQSVLDETVLWRSGRTVLISGEPGIGKTRLLAESAERAAAQGWVVLVGRSYESEGMPPYLPFAEALRQYVQACPEADLRTQVDRGAPEVALLVPELLERVPGIEPGPPPGQDERHRLFEAVAGFLLRAAAAHQKGILLVIDDLHWADQDTLLLLRHLARRLSEAPLLVAATCRSTEVDRSRPFNDTLSALHRERLCQQLDVGPFTSEEAGQLIGTLAGTYPSPRVVASVHRRTGGNPFFLEEVVRSLSAEGRDLAEEDPASPDWAIPETVRQVIGSRLSRLHAETLSALQAASALGDAFSFDALAVAVGTSLGPLLDALDQASAGGFVREESSGEYRFSHSLVRETVYAGLSGPRRALLHARIGEGLETLYRANSAAHAGELAHHFLLGGRQGDLEKTMGYALQAAEHATRHTAFEDALRYHRMALGAHDRGEEPDEARRCEMLLALAAATFKAGNWDLGDEINLAAAESAHAAELPDLLARACLATAAAVGPKVNPRLLPLLEAALAATPRGDSALRSGLLSLLAYQKSKAASWEEQSPMRKESIAMARRLGDVRALAFTLRNAYLGRNFGDMNRLADHLLAIEEVVELARELGDKQLEVTSQCDHLTGSLVLGDIAAVDAGIEAHIRLADELQQRMQMGHAFALRMMRALLSEPLPLAERLHNEYSLRWAASPVNPFHLVLAWEQGRLAEFQPALQAALDRQSTPIEQAELAFCCGELGDPAGARAVIEQLGAGRFAAIPFDFDWPFALALLSQAAFAIGGAQHAEVLYDLLLPRSHEVVTSSNAAVCLGSTSRFLGMLATILGRFGDAERHFDDADAMNGRLDARPLLAHTRADRARMHLARHARGDTARARGLLRQAAEAFDELEIPHHAGRARDLLEHLPQAGLPRPTLPHGLSEREAEVLRLIARGQTNAEIADALVISPHTVGRHVSNIFDKLDIAHRADAAAWAVRNGLAE